MIKLKSKVRLRSEECAYSVGENGDRIDYPVPKTLIFDAAVDPLSSTFVISDAEDLRSHCRRALCRYIIDWVLSTLLILTTVNIACDSSGLCLMLALVIGILSSEHALCLPTGAYKDIDGNIIYTQGSYIVDNEGSRVQLHTRGFVNK